MGLDHHNPPPPSSSQSGTSQKWSVVSGFDREKRNLRWAGAGWLDVGVWKTLAHQSKSSVIRRNTGVFFFPPFSSPFIVNSLCRRGCPDKRRPNEAAATRKCSRVEKISFYAGNVGCCCCWVLAGLLNLSPGNFVSWCKVVEKTS